MSLFADGFSPWHWHEYFEFGIIHRGTMELYTQQHSFHLCEGEGYFVNSNILHANRMIDSNVSTRIHVHQFDRQMIGSTDLISQRYIMPIAGCTNLDALTLSPGDSLQNGILQNIIAAFDAAEMEPFGFELRISTHLMRAWQGLCELVGPVLEHTSSISQDETSRIKLMLSFIHANYADAINVATIANAANIGERECFRCFRQTLGITPTLYLMHHRINAAAHLLITTSRTITEIAADCGFSSSSYFCKVFREVVGKTPKEFRSKK